MRPANMRVLRRCGGALTLIAALALASAAQAAPPRPTLVNKCACACMSTKQNQAVVDNFTTTGACLTFNGWVCAVKSPRPGGPPVVGKYGLCLSNGKKWEMR